MEQEKIGKFISELRKEKGLTQKKLAEQLHITDKAVSKWECGYSLPDNAVMLELCEVLGISVNELLSGERLSSSDYNRKAEENIMTLIQENTEHKKRNKKQLALNALVVILLAGYFIWFVNASTSYHLQMRYFVDGAAFIVVTMLMLLMLVLSGQLKAFFKIFKYAVRGCDDDKKVENAKKAASFAVKSVLLSGGICSVIYFVNWMRCLDDAAEWGPNLAKIVLGLFYSLIISGILMVLRERIK